MAHNKEFFEDLIRQEFEGKNNAPETAGASRKDYTNPNRRTFAPEWVDVPAGTPPPMEAQRAPVAAPQPAQQGIDPQVAVSLIGALMGRSVDNLPKELLRAAAMTTSSDTPQIGAAPVYRELTAGNGNYEQGADGQSDGDESVYMVSRRRKLLQLPEGLKGYARRHKVIATMSAVSLCATVGFTGYRLNTGGTIADAVATVKSDFISRDNYTKLDLPAEDCITTTMALNIESESDMLIKVNMATAADIAKSKADKKFKLPTTSSFLPKMELPAVAFPETPEEKEKAKTNVARYPRMLYRNDVKLAACDESKKAFRQEAGSIIVNLALISLKPSTPVANDKDAPKNMRDDRESPELTEIKSNDTRYAIAPGDMERIRTWLNNKDKAVALHNEHKALVFDGINKGDAQLQVRKMLREYLENKLRDLAAKQGEPNIKVVFEEGDPEMPGEVYRKDIPPVLIDSKDADVQNPQIKITNLRLVGGAS